MCPTVCNPLDYSPPGSSIHGILQARYWSELPCPPPGDLPNPGIEPMPPAALPLQVYSSPLSHQWSLVRLYWQLDLSLGSLTEILPPEGWDSKHAPWGHEVWDDLLQQRQEAHLPSPGQLLAAPAKDQARRGLQVGTPERTAWPGEYPRHPFFSSAYTLSRKTQNLCASWIKGP